MFAKWLLLVLFSLHVLSACKSTDKGDDASNVKGGIREYERLPRAIYVEDELIHLVRCPLVNGKVDDNIDAPNALDRSKCNRHNAAVLPNGKRDVFSMDYYEDYLPLLISILDVPVSRQIPASIQKLIDIERRRIEVFQKAKEEQGANIDILDRQIDRIKNKIAVLEQKGLDQADYDLPQNITDFLNLNSKSHLNIGARDAQVLLKPFRLFESRSGDLAGRTRIEELQVTLRRDLFNYLVANGDKNRVVQTYQDRPCYNLVKLKDLFDSILKIYKSTDSEADSVNLLFSYTYKKPICRVSPYVGTLTREVTVPSLTGQ